MHSTLTRLESTVIQLLVLAAKIWTCSNIPQETPSREWLCQYLTVTLGSGVYDAWEKKDLIWAIYSYFTWKTPVKTEAGVTEAIYDLAIIAGMSDLVYLASIKDISFATCVWIEARGDESLRGQISLALVEDAGEDALQKEHR